MKASLPTPFQPMEPRSIILPLPNFTVPFIQLILQVSSFLRHTFLAPSDDIRLNLDSSIHKYFSRNNVILRSSSCLSYCNSSLQRNCSSKFLESSHYSRYCAVGNYGLFLNLFTRSTTKLRWATAQCLPPLSIFL